MDSEDDSPASLVDSSSDSEGCSDCSGSVDADSSSDCSDCSDSDEEGLTALNRVKKEHPRHEVLLPPEMFQPQHRMPRRGRPSAMDSDKMRALGAATAALDPDGQIKTEL